MSNRDAPVVVAGHICFDVIPTLGELHGGLADLLVPGSLTEIGPAVFSTGGAVSNTGLALERLGLPTRLMGKVGDDLFGRATLDVVRRRNPALAEGMIITRGEPSSYTVVLSPPNIDRMFLHCRGANDTFCAADIPYDKLRGARLFHFGYPPIMRRMYADGGTELAAMFEQVRQRGVTTSLDMSMPDPSGPSGRVQWRPILKRVLPLVDVFLPSFEEILFVLDRARFERFSAGGDLLLHANGELLSELGGALLDMGVAVAGLKLGDRGLYVRTTADPGRLEPVRCAAGAALEDWCGRELYTPCYAVDVVGTTGCGDSTIAGFLAGLLHGLPLEETLETAIGVGACTAEKADSTSGVPTWEALRKRLSGNWSKRPGPSDWPGWRITGAGIRLGPNDSA